MDLGYIEINKDIFKSNKKFYASDETKMEDYKIYNDRIFTMNPSIEASVRKGYIQGDI